MGKPDCQGLSFFRMIAKVSSFWTFVSISSIMLWEPNFYCFLPLLAHMSKLSWSMEPGCYCIICCALTLFSFIFLDAYQLGLWLLIGIDTELCYCWWQTYYFCWLDYCSSLNYYFY
jgi:hypothetical protein